MSIKTRLSLRKLYHDYSDNYVYTWIVLVNTKISNNQASPICRESIYQFSNDPLQWRQNGHDGVSNQQPCDCYSTVHSGTYLRKHQRQMTSNAENDDDAIMHMYFFTETHGNRRDWCTEDEKRNRLKTNEAPEGRIGLSAHYTGSLSSSCSFIWRQYTYKYLLNIFRWVCA